MVILYLIIYHLVSNWSAMTGSLAFILTGDTVILLLEATLLWYVNIYSHQVTEEIRELKYHLKASVIDEGSVIYEFEGKRMPASLIKSCVEDRLGEFRGFDGKGYFTLGKSFLKNLIAFCVTYLIILIQFKMTEK